MDPLNLPNELSEEQLCRFADKLLVRGKRQERLKKLWDDYGPTNGLAMFNVITARFERLKNQLDKSLLVELKLWHGNEKHEDYPGPLKKLRQDPERSVLVADYLPDFADSRLCMTWQEVDNAQKDVEGARDAIERARIVKESESLNRQVGVLGEEYANRIAALIPIEQPGPTGEQPSANHTKITQGALALFYYYGQRTDEMPHFPEGQREQAYREVTEPYGLSAGNFKIRFNALHKEAERMHLDNRNSIVQAIELLAGYPKSKALAEDELRVAKIRDKRR